MMNTLLFRLLFIFAIAVASNFSNLPQDVQQKIYNYLPLKMVTDSLLTLTRDTYWNFFMSQYPESIKAMQEFREILSFILRNDTTEFQDKIAFNDINRLLFQQNLIYDELLQLKLPGVIKMIQNAVSPRRMNKILSEMNLLPLISADFSINENIFDPLVTDKLKMVLCLLRYASRGLLAPVSCLQIDHTQLKIIKLMMRGTTIRERLIHPNYAFIDMNLSNETEIAIRRVCLGYFYRFMFDENRQELEQIDPILIERFGIIPWKRGALDEMIKMSVRNIAGYDEEKFIKIMFHCWVIFTSKQDFHCFGKGLDFYDQHTNQSQISITTKRLLMFTMFHVVKDGHTAIQYNASSVPQKNETNTERKTMILTKIFPWFLEKMKGRKGIYNGTNCKLGLFSTQQP